jgi:peptide/nickel transport system permease protein
VSASTNRPLWRRTASSPAAVVAIGYLVVVIVISVIGSWITPKDPNSTDVRNVLADPFTAGHVLGTDSAGRDVLSRLIVATQNSLLAVLIAVVVAMAIGVVTGLLAGYFAGWFDTLSSWVTNLVMAMPGIVVLLAARSVLGPSIFSAMLIFGVLIAPSYIRLVSNIVRAVRNELYIDAAKVSGISDSRIIGRHILGVVRGPIVIQTAIVSSVSIAVMAGLSVLGFGDITTATWGSMLSDGFGKMFRQPWLLLWPALVIALTSLAFTVVANTLRDELEGGARNRQHRKAIETTSEQLAMMSTAFENAAPTTVATFVHPSPTPIEPLLSVRGLVVGYPDDREQWTKVVDGVDLDVARGEVLGLVGESGSGKTQTAFAVMGLLGVGGRILAGRVEFDGLTLTDSTAKALSAIRGRRIAYVPQEPMSNLDPCFTIGSQLMEPMRVCLGIDKATAKRQALALLDRVGIKDPARVVASYPHELSGGMAQRVLIAGAVASQPDLIIADEPTTALDVTVQAEILDLLRELQREMNTSLLVVTHNLGVVADLADRVAVMQHGHIVEVGPVRDTIRAPQHPYTRSLLAAILDGQPARSAYMVQELRA